MFFVYFVTYTSYYGGLIESVGSSKANIKQMCPQDLFFVHHCALSYSRPPAGGAVGGVCCGSGSSGRMWCDRHWGRSDDGAEGRSAQIGIWRRFKNTKPDEQVNKHCVFYGRR